MRGKAAGWAGVLGQGGIGGTPSRGSLYRVLHPQLALGFVADDQAWARPPKPPTFREFLSQHKTEVSRRKKKSSRPQPKAASRAYRWGPPSPWTCTAQRDCVALPLVVFWLVCLGDISVLSFPICLGHLSACGSGTWFWGRRGLAVALPSSVPSTPPTHLFCPPGPSLPGHLRHPGHTPYFLLGTLACRLLVWKSQRPALSTC